MNDEALNLSIRKFLKLVGVSSQREIEHAVAKAIADAGYQGYVAHEFVPTWKDPIKSLEQAYEIFTV